jgi:pimeloyl-ACP methyl ester carboxylesterase
VVFAHGYALTLDTFRHQRAALQGRARLVFFDQRSHGRSHQAEFDTHHIDQLGHDLGAVIDAVAPTGPLVLVGHSMGGMTIMALADQRPDLIRDRVFGIALISTSAGGVQDLHLALPLGLSRAFDVLAPPVAAALAKRKGLVERSRWQDTDLGLMLIRLYSFGSTGTEEGSRFVASMVSATPVEAIAEFLPALQEHDKRDSLGAFEGVDLLVMVGDKDRLTPPERSVEIVERIPGAEYILVHDAGHMLPIEKHEAVDEALVQLVDRALRASREPVTGGIA